MARPKDDDKKPPKRKPYRKPEVVKHGSLEPEVMAFRALY